MTGLRLTRRVKGRAGTDGSPPWTAPCCANFSSRSRTPTGKTPEKLVITLRARGQPGDDISCSVETSRALAVRGAIAQLSARQRAVVVLRYYEDLTDQQIASVLSCPVGSVKSSLHRAAAILRQHLDQEE